MRCTAFLLVMVLVPATAAAQEAANSFAELTRQQVLDEGDKIRLSCDLGGDGEYLELEAELVSLTELFIVVGVGKLASTPTDLPITPPSQMYGKYAIEIPRDRVQSIETRESIRRWGLLIGAVGGGAWGAVAGQWAEEEGCDNCQWAMVTYSCALGAGIGYLIDRVRRGWEPVYVTHPESPGSPTYSLSPMISKKRKGVLFTVTW